MMKGKSQGEPSYANFACKIHYPMVNSVNRNENRLEWIIDTRASDHMISNSSLLSSKYRLVNPIYIGLPDGSVKTVNEAGKLQFTENVYLNDVLVVPGFKHNLMSVGKLLEDSKMIVSFSSTGCIFQDHGSKEILLRIIRREGLYKIEQLVEGREQTCNFISSKDINILVNVNSSKKVELSMRTMHARLGHPCLSKLKHVFPSVVLENEDTFCETCVIAKHHALPFARSNNISKEIFGMIHVDL